MSLENQRLAWCLKELLPCWVRFYFQYFMLLAQMFKLRWNLRSQGMGWSLDAAVRSVIVFLVVYWIQWRDFTVKPWKLQECHTQKLTVIILLWFLVCYKISRLVIAKMCVTNWSEWTFIFVLILNTFVIAAWNLDYLKECSILLTDCTIGGERKHERSKIKLFSTLTLHVLFYEHFVVVSQSWV